MPFLEKTPSPKDATSPLICIDCKVCTILFPGKKKPQTFKVILIAGKESCNVICVIVLRSAGIWKTLQLPLIAEPALGIHGCTKAAFAITLRCLYILQVFNISFHYYHI